MSDNATIRAMGQWAGLKTANPDRICLVGCGDFLETFQVDAEQLALRLNLTLTTKMDGRARLAGVPRHRGIERLAAAGIKPVVREYIPAESDLDLASLPLWCLATVPQRFQRRSKDFAADTVEAIVQEGWCAEKFDPIPVCRIDDRWCCGGDGHSRLEALRRLQRAGKLPEWVAAAVPVRVVAPEAGDRLADTANVSRTPFTPMEEAVIFARRLKAGETPEQIGRSMHRSAHYVMAREPIAELCEQVKQGIGTQWGMTVDQAIVFARACRRFHVNHEEQQTLWIDWLSKGDFTPMAVEAAVRAYAKKIRGSSGGQESGMLFEIPRNVRQGLGELDRLYRRTKHARAALLTLRQSSDLLGPELKDVIIRHADRERARMVQQINDLATELGAGTMAWHYGTPAGRKNGKTEKQRKTA